MEWPISWADVKKAMEIPMFNLNELGIPPINPLGDTASIEIDTSEIIDALDKGLVRFSFALNSDNNPLVTATVTAQTAPIFGGYQCFTIAHPADGVCMLVTFNIKDNYLGLIVTLLTTSQI